MQVTEVSGAKGRWIRKEFFFYKIIWSKLALLAYYKFLYFRYFIVVFTKRTPELAENKQNIIFFFMEAYF